MVRVDEESAGTRHEDKLNFGNMYKRYINPLEIRPSNQVQECLPCALEIFLRA